MKTDRAAPESIGDYIAAFPADVQQKLEQLRRAIKAAEPAAEETISYQMPSFSLNGRNLVYFAAFKKHIGLYPAPTGIAEFADDLATYAAGKGTLQFPLAQPLPLELIGRIVRFRANEILAKPAKKKHG
jgi:uncharacterized protein YdhG (YjbR/CyaY superfamily)